VRALATELGVPVGGVLEGGYDLAGLATSTAATLEALAGDGEPRSVEPDALTARAAEHLARWWPVRV
jgi:acetoin utilization deacetylase AcuC-like enzyme